MLPRQCVAEQEVKDCRLLLLALRVCPLHLLVAWVDLNQQPLGYKPDVIVGCKFPLRFSKSFQTLADISLDLCQGLVRPAIYGVYL